MTRPRWAALALAVLAAGVYANATANGFALDDEFIVVNNPRVHGTDQLGEIFTEPYWPNSPDRLGLYRPLTAATYAVEWEVWGDDPLPFHVTNILLHALATVLVFGLLAGWVGLAPATAGAAIFAVHPVHVEAVANIVGRAELLAAIFVLAAILVYLRAGLTRSRIRLWGGAVLIAGLYFLGLLAKEIAVSLPALLLVLEAGRARGSQGSGRADHAGHDAGTGSSVGSRGGGGAGTTGTTLERIASYARRVLARWPVYGMLAVSFGAYLAVRATVLGTAVGNDAAGYLQALGPGERVMTAVAVWPEYLRLMVFPLELVADYSPGVLMPVTTFGPRLVLGFRVAGVVALVAVRAWRSAPTVTIGALVFALAVLPVSNLLVPVGILLAERTLYLPSVGLALAVAGCWRWIERHRSHWRPVALAVLAAAVALGGARTWTRTPTWKNTATVLRTLARDHPESFRVQWMMADQLYANDRIDVALQHYERAVALEPFHYTLRVQYGVALMEAGHHDRAVDAFRMARETVPELADAHIFLTVAFLDAGQPEQAAAAGREGLRWRPDHRGIHHQLAIALTRTGDFDAALEARRQSIRLGGDRAAWTQFLHEAELLLRLGREEAAREALDRARERTDTPTAVPDLAALRAAVDTADLAVLPYR